MSEKKHYHWKRFWVPREGSIRFDEDGFLADPEDESYKQLNAQVVSVDQIMPIPCLVLLGEPGIGKSTALEQIKANETSTGNKPIFIDLRSYGSEDRLYRAIFESKEFVEWTNSPYRLEIFLDSLDECLIHIRTVASLLADEFRKYPTSRLALRIACRTAEWPELLQEELPGIWKAGNYGVYELAPLRRVDVENAMQVEGLNSKKFLTEIAHREVTPLAIKPITLQFLIESFRDQKELPASKVELYVQGCKRLCRDENPSRIASGVVGQLDPDQRLAVAQWIAAVMMFCKRSAILIGIDDGSANPDDITISQLSVVGEGIKGIAVEMTQAAIREVVATGLFSGRVHQRMGWSHWTFSEFLSAHFVVTSGLTENQIADLIIHPNTDLVGRSKVVPQLHEVAAWIATLRPELIDIFVSTDPQVLLRSSFTDSLDQPKLVAALLGLLDAGKLTDMHNDLRRKYKLLNHPGLAKQIEQYVIDPHRNFVVRRAAIDIAEACEVVSLAEVLLKVSLDKSETPHIRAQAANAIVRIGTASDKLRLRPLLNSAAHEDPNEDLKGLALQALWPEQMSVEDLFSFITISRNDNYYGTYSSFLHDQLLGGLTEKDLPVALDWVGRQPEDHSLPFDLQRFIAGLMKRAWEHLQNEAVLDAFVGAAIARIQRHDAIISAQLDEESQEMMFASDAEKRRRLIQALLPELQSKQIRLSWLCFNPNRLIKTEDVSWLLELLKSTKSVHDQKQLGELIMIVFDRENVLEIDAVLTLIKGNEALAESFSAFWKPVVLNSDEARQQKEHSELSRPGEPVEESLPQPLSKILDDWLDKFEGGDLDAWWRMNLDMTLQPTRNRYPPGQELISDLTALPGWKEMDSRNHARCMTAAIRYLNQGDPHTADWLGTDRFHRPAAAGYRALRLLRKESPRELEKLSGKVWEKWAPVILAYWEPGSDAASSMEELAALAYKFSPESMISALLVSIEHESRDHKGGAFVIRKMIKCWDERLTTAVIEILKRDPSVDPFFQGKLAEELVANGGDLGSDFVLSLLETPVPPAGPSRDRIRELMIALLNWAPGKSFSTIWPNIENDLAFRRELFLAFAYRHQHGHVSRIAGDLSEEDLASLYLWLAREFPHAQDPKHSGAYTIGPRDMIKDFRDSLLSHLKNRGTVSAYKAVRRIEKQLPDVNWLMYETLEAGKVTLEKTWHGQTPESLLKLTRDKHARMVENGDQLLDIIVDSLNVLEAKLQGETPLARALWNDAGTPKDENWLSDFVKMHLNEDLRTRGLVANREVEIRAGVGNPGEVVDIHVDAETLGHHDKAFDRITAIIETKGCWHRDLKTAMRTQLIDRYLKDNQCRYGLYLVGWFACPQWSDQDYRREQTPKWTLNEARTFLQKQATEVSGPNITIRAFVLNTALR